MLMAVVFLEVTPLVGRGGLATIATHDRGKGNLHWWSITACIDTERWMGAEESKEWLLPLFLVIRAPGSIGPLRAMASATPVPLAAIAQEDIYSQGSLYSYFKFICPPWSFSSHREIIKPREVKCNG